MYNMIEGLFRKVVNKMFKTQRRTPVKNNRVRNRTVVSTKDLRNENLKSTADFVVKAVVGGNPRVSVQMGEDGDTSAKRMMAVKAIKIALETPELATKHSEIAIDLNVIFYGNQTAGNFYKAIILDKNISSSDVKIEG